ncbi:unnamed protein product, partial [Closterium sp. NIES-53]
AALLSIKSAMGLTYTTWAATNPCTLDGTTGKAGEWERVSCTAFGRAYVINLDSAGLQRKSFPADISKLTGLGAVWMPWNYLDGSLSEYLKYFSALTNLNQLAMQYMFFSGTFPSLLTSLPSLTSLSLRFNYLTGSLPTSITKIKSLDINQNYFVGSIPSGTWSYCDAGNNCLASVGNCQSYFQRSSCAICGSTDGTGTLCAAGQACLPSSDAKIAAGQKNYNGEVALSCVVQPITMNSADAAALLSIKSAMGLTYTTWAATNPCTLDGTTGKAGEWERVSCTAFGRAYVINLDSAGLQRKSFPADISKLTGLGSVWMPWNYLDGSLSEYLKYFSALTNLNQLAMQYMFFSGTFPSLLTSLPSLTSL